MKIKATFLGCVVLFCLQSCNKTYNCVCTDPGGSEIVQRYHSTKTKAEEKCRSYYQVHCNKVPMDETFCEIE